MLVASGSVAMRYVLPFLSMSVTVVDLYRIYTYIIAKPLRHCVAKREHTHTYHRLTALCPRLPGWAGNRKEKSIWILLKQETVSGSGIHWAICKSAPRSRQITMPAPHCSVFYRPDALPATQPTVSKHWRHQQNENRKAFTSRQNFQTNVTVLCLHIMASKRWRERGIYTKRLKRGQHGSVTMAYTTQLKPIHQGAAPN